MKLLCILSLLLFGQLHGNTSKQQRIKRALSRSKNQSLNQIRYGYPYHLTLCAIFQNEAPYLKEWIDYHLKVGVEHFWLYNNNSKDDYYAVLAEYIEDGIIEFLEWPSDEDKNDCTHFTFTVQMSAYNDALSKARNISKWMALIDTDEFIVPVNESTVSETLEKYYSDAAGVCVNWQCYGTSNIWKAPEGELVRNLIWKLPKDHPKNLYFKSIVRPSLVSYTNNPHFCFYLSDYCHINAIGEKIVHDNTGVYIDKIRINHYWTRDGWFLMNVKVPRYKKWGTDNILELADEMNQECDAIMLNKVK